jgi:peptide-methionine (S)-S-oxide reductase
MQFLFRSPSMPTPTRPCPAAPRRSCSPGTTTILGTPIAGPYPEGFQIAEFALGCFWGEEKTFWEQPGVWTTAVGYQGGFTPNPTYEESVHRPDRPRRAVRVVFDPAKTSYESS